MNKLTIQKRAQIIGMLVEGNSLRSVSRMADCSINTVTKLLRDVGTACSEYQDGALRNLPCKRVQCDEIWSFVYAKERNAAPQMKAAGEAGDIWTWTAICADIKLMVSWMVGDRSPETAHIFMHDLADRLANRVQLTTDGNGAYIHAVDNAFEGAIDYARLIKLYGNTAGAPGRYSPGEVTGIREEVVSGNPRSAHVSTSYVERANLTMRMGMRRFTRLTNGFSKKAENHAHAVSLHFMYYNFGRVHKSLRVTPAMQAGVTDHVWSLEEIAALIPEPVSKPRGPYKKKNSN